MSFSRIASTSSSFSVTPFSPSNAGRLEVRHPWRLHYLSQFCWSRHFLLLSCKFLTYARNKQALCQIGFPPVYHVVVVLYMNKEGLERDPPWNEAAQG